MITRSISAARFSATRDGEEGQSEAHEWPALAERALPQVPESHS